MNTPAKNTGLDLLMKTPIDTTRQQKTQRTTSPINQPYYFKQNFLNNMLSKPTDQKTYQSFDNLYKQESPFYRPHNVTNPVFAENRGYLPKTSANDNNVSDFFQSCRSGAFSERIDLSPNNHFKDLTGFDERLLGMRRGSSSEAYLNAIKALQEKVGYLSERVKHVESENGFLKNLQEEQRLERGREERQFQDSTLSILEKLENLGNENMVVKKENKELEELNQALGKENIKLAEDKKKLKKKLVAMKSETKTQKEMIGELEKKLQKLQTSAEENGQKAKTTEDQLQEEVRNLRKDKEGLEFKVANLSEVVKKQENDLSQGKKIYNQHLEKLALANEALVLDNQQIKDHYSHEISEFGAELEMIHQANAHKISEYEEDIAELKNDNSKLTELLKMKNEEIQALRARNREEDIQSELRNSLHTVRSRLTAMRTTQSPPKTEKNDTDSPKLSSSMLTSFTRDKSSHTTKEKTSGDLYKQAKMLLAAQGDAAKRVNSKEGLSSVESSPEREINYSKLTTRSNMSRHQRYNRNEETNVSRSKTPTENRAYWKPNTEASPSSNDDNSAFLAYSGELKSRREKKEAKYHAYAEAMRTSTRDYSPSLDQSAYETSNTRSNPFGGNSGEKRENQRSNYGTFGADDKGIHKLFYSNEEGNDHREVQESFRDEDQSLPRPKTQKSFFDVIQNGY